VLRDDDREETVKRRLEIYRTQTRPLVDYYQRLAPDKYRRISGHGSLDEITKRSLAALS